jgi:hypothetical protein
MKLHIYLLTSVLFININAGSAAILKIQDSSEASFFCNSRFINREYYLRCMDVLKNKFVDIRTLRLVDQTINGENLSDPAKLSLLESLSLPHGGRRSDFIYNLLESFTTEEALVEATQTLKKIPQISDTDAKRFVRDIVDSSTSQTDRLNRLKKFNY